MTSFMEKSENICQKIKSLLDHFALKFKTLLFKPFVHCANPMFFNTSSIFSPFLYANFAIYIELYTDFLTQ